MNNSTKSGIMSNINRSREKNKLFDLDQKSHFNTKQYSTLFDFKKDIHFVCKNQCRIF